MPSVDNLVIWVSIALGLLPYALVMGVLFFLMQHGCAPWSRPGWLLLWHDVLTEGCR